MAKVYVKVVGDTYTVVLDELSKTEAMAVREGFSALDVNQKWAMENQGSLTEAVRHNTVLAELHSEYKSTIRDVSQADEEEYIDEDEDFIEDEEDSWEAKGFTA